MTPQPEFSRPVRIDTLGSAARAMRVDADEGERAALAERFDLVAIAALHADLTLRRSGDTVIATGTVSAKVTQSCVATGEAVPARVEEEFTILFRPAQEGDAAEDEIELSEEDCDVVFYTGGSIDVGEAVAETLSLSLDPWPRSPNADALLRAEGVRTEEEAAAEEAKAKEARSPFAALKPKS